MKKATLFILCFFASLSAQIVEITRFEELLNYVTPHTLIVLDIDNTLIEPTQQLGSDQWFTRQFKELEESGMRKEDALKKALSEWMAVQNISKMQTVEQTTAKIVSSLQKKGYTLFGLTTRGLGMSTRTNEQLEQVGIDLSLTAPSADDLFFMNGRGVLYRGGTVFTANTHKGRALFTYLDSIGYKPKRIVFVNDKRSHILPIEEWAEQRGVPFIGLRYGYLDQKVESLDLELTKVQWERFGKILSDEEAAHIIQEEACAPESLSP